MSVLTAPHDGRGICLKLVIGQHVSSLKNKNSYLSLEASSSTSELPFRPETVWLNAMIFSYYCILLS